MFGWTSHARRDDVDTLESVQDHVADDGRDEGRLGLVEVRAGGRRALDPLVTMLGARAHRQGVAVEIVSVIPVVL